MKLVVGGSNQGKTEFVMEKLCVPARQIVSGEEMERLAGSDNQDASEKRAVNCLHSYIRKALKQGRNQEEIRREIVSWTERFPELILICDEIGCGVVPIDAFERDYREVTGRICCILAERADVVIRVCCGIGSVIKKSASGE